MYVCVSECCVVLFSLFPFCIFVLFAVVALFVPRFYNLATSGFFLLLFLTVSFQYFSTTEFCCVCMLFFQFIYIFFFHFSFIRIVLLKTSEPAKAVNIENATF